MPTGLRGNRGKLVIGASAAVAQVTQWQRSGSAESIETTAMDPAASDGPIPKTFIVGNTSWEITLTCNVDRSDTDGQAAMVEGAVAVPKLYPEGDATGKKYWSGADGFITKMTEQGEVAGKITYTATIQGSGALTLQTA